VSERSSGRRRQHREPGERVGIVAGTAERALDGGGRLEPGIDDDVAYALVVGAERIREGVDRPLRGVLEELPRVANLALDRARGELVEPVVVHAVRADLDLGQVGEIPQTRGVEPARQADQTCRDVDRGRNPVRGQQFERIDGVEMAVVERHHDRLRGPLGVAMQASGELACRHAGPAGGHDRAGVLGKPLRGRDEQAPGLVGDAVVEQDRDRSRQCCSRRRRLPPHAAAPS
jgi:hypothetical protein